MNAIISLLTILVGTCLPWLLKFFTKKALVLVYLASLTAMTVVFYKALSGGISAISANLPANSYFLMGLSMLPTNTTKCITLVAVGHAARWLYLWQSKYIKSLLAKGE